MAEEETVEEETETPTATEEPPKEKTTEEIVAEFADAQDAEDEPSEEDKAKAKEEEPGKGESEGEEGETDTAEDGTPKKKKLSRNAKKHSRLLKQVDEARGETAEVLKKLQASEEEKELYKKALAQLKEEPDTLKKPNPDDFTDGVDDPDYQKAKDAYDEAIIEKKVSEKLEKATTQQAQKLTQEQQAENLKKRQNAHWEKADAESPEDYSDKEAALVDVLGVDMVNHIIENCPEDSHKVVYYLGTNEEEALELGTMLSNRASMVRGVLKLGRIQAKLASPVKPKPKPAASPDEELEGREGKRFKKRGPTGAKFY